MDTPNTTTMQDSSNVALALEANGIDWNAIGTTVAVISAAFASSAALGYALDRVEQRKRRKRDMVETTYNVTAKSSLPEDEAIKLQELAAKNDRTALKTATLEALGKTQDPQTKLRLREVLATCVV